MDTKCFPLTLINSYTDVNVCVIRNFDSKFEKVDTVFLYRKFPSTDNLQIP